jgi:molybdopterin-biosynthesis enzyme MoeA-like protein
MITTTEFGAYIAAESEKWAEVVRFAGIKPECDLKEVRLVGDEERAIVDSLNALRHRCTYVFTTGGIGPTHDDITADCVAKAFGVPIDNDNCDHRWEKPHFNDRLGLLLPFTPPA